MSLKNIIINLNDVDNIDATLTTTCELARRHNAHLVGVYVVPSFQLKMGVYGSDSIMLDLQYSELKKYKKLAAETVEKFEKALKANDILGKSIVLNSADANIAEEFINHAHTTDLIVIPCVDTENYCGVEDDFAEKVILESGRPVILIPRGKSFENIGNRINVGWNLSAESSRACFDMLPLISPQSDIRIIWIDGHLKSNVAGNLPGSEIAEALAHHGLNVSIESVVSEDRNIGQALLHDAAVNGADLMVMGAYGHSRLRELIFGGATKYVLANLNIPVLMSC